jgi:hypothetical protein
MFTVHWLLLVLSQPLQLLKPELALAVAVMTTLSPKLVLAGQAPFAPALTAHCTVPLPVPPLVWMVSVSVCLVKVAVTETLAVTLLSAHGLAVEAPQPAQLVKFEPVTPAAVMARLSPELTVTGEVQAAAAPPFTTQLKVPVPSLALPVAMLMVTCAVSLAKLAVTVLLAVIATVHLLVETLSQPVQLVKLEPALAVAVITTLSLEL